MKQGVSNIIGQSLAEAVANGLQAISLLLCVDQVGFGKYGTPGCNIRYGRAVLQGHVRKLLCIFQVETERLLVQETACTCSTGGTVAGLKVFPILIQFQQVEPFGPHMQDGTCLQFQESHSLHQGYLLIEHLHLLVEMGFP